MDGLIGLDWGTSSLRAYRLDAAGNLLETRQRAWGIRQLPEGGFDAALADVVAGWPALPLMACGMVGSCQGWREVPYVELPAGIHQLAHVPESVRTADGRLLCIVPGLRNRRGPDVMRGEETQCVGGLAMRPETGSRSTWILPGTHSKWVSVRDHVIVDFSTVMTGEVFALLRRYSILGVGMDTADEDPEAFARGVVRARDSGESGAFGQLFSTRALMLDGALAPASTADYLSGLLIGEEWRSMLASRRFDTAAPVHLMGADALCRRYRHAAGYFDMAVAEPVGDAAAHGLWHMACHAGLVAGGSSSLPSGAR